MPRIDIDQDIYDELAKHARGFEQPNQVLRRLILGEKQTNVVDRSRPRGSLAPLLDAGLMKPGDRLIHYQKRKKATHTATVEADGNVRTRLGLYRDTSPALGELVGTAISGPALWLHEPSGKSINQLKALL